MQQAAVDIKPVQPGITINFRDAQGFLREGTVTGTTSIGYSVLPSHGSRMLVTPDRIVSN